MRGRKGERRQSAAGAVNFWTAAHASRTIRDLSDQQPLLRIIAGGSQPAGGILVGAVGGEGVEQETASRPGQSVPADDRHAVHLLPDLFGIDVHESGHLDGEVFKEDPSFRPLSEEELEELNSGE